MAEFLPKTHRIIEKGEMAFRPFGKDPNGKRIQDVSGVTVRANVEYLEALMTRREGREAGAEAVRHLVRLVNERISDRSFHVSADFLKNPWNSYSYEFVMFLTEFCVILSDDPHFQFNLGREKFLSPIIQALGRPFSITQIFKMYPYFVEKFTKGALLPQVVSVTNGRATMRLQLSDRTIQQFGPYRLGCADRICQSTKATIGEVPARMFGLPPAVIQETACLGNGDEYCEWTFTWQPQVSRAFLWPAIGLVMGLAVLAWLSVQYPALPTMEEIGLAIIPVIMFWLAGALWNDRREIQERGKVIQEQLHAAESRHEELREAYLTQEQILVALRKRINELTMLHQTGLRIGATLDQDALISSGLEAIIHELHYDHAALAFYDQGRRVAHHAHVGGVTPDVAESTHAIEIPITNDKSLEAQVLIHGTPLLINRVPEALPKFHPIHQDLIARLQSSEIIAVPLKAQGKIIGALAADHVQPQPVTAEDVNVLTTVANQMAIALDNARAYAEIGELNVGLETKVRERTARLQQLNDELEKANERLKELDRLKSQFLSHCSHELRTPLTSIKGFSENLLQGIIGPLTDRQHQYLTRINRNADRLTRMIADLLDLSRIESGNIRMMWEPVSISAVIQEVVDQLLLMAQSQEQHLEIRNCHETVSVIGDKDRLHQVMTNLVHNALKFTPRKGSVFVDIQSHPPLVVVMVSDTGPGISSEALPNLFNPFFQAHQDQEIGGKGLGLGLAIVKHLVDLHQGSITIQSELGHGTMFRVALPAQRSPSLSD